MRRPRFDAGTIDVSRASGRIVDALSVALPGVADQETCSTSRFGSVQYSRERVGTMKESDSVRGVLLARWGRDASAVARPQRARQRRALTCVSICLI